MSRSPSDPALLMICYKFPPMHSVSTRRMLALYHAFGNHFKTIKVISTTNRHLLSSGGGGHEGIDIYDAPTHDYRTVIQGRTGKPASASESLKQSWIGRMGLRLQASFPTMYWLGEGGRQYRRAALRQAGSLVEEHGITHVFSSFPPYADHWVAARLKRAFPRLTWIADFRDLHVDPAQDNLLFRNYQLRINRKILKSATVLTTVSEGLADHLRALHPRVHVLRNGILRGIDHATLYERFTISYTGSMFQNKRRPDPLVQVLARCLADRSLVADHLTLRYAGKDSDVWHETVR
ncbi:MAG: hypothetical protein R3330_19930, partial [Saprospiraceae bacterium]|nr:hypothetical protein [Saprospiraceae bacterium]